MFFELVAVLNVMFTHFYLKLLGASRKKDATDEVRKLIYQTLLARSNNGRLGKGVTREVASQFGLHIRTVQKIWKRGKESLAQGIVINVTSRKKGQALRKLQLIWNLYAIFLSMKE